MSSSNVNTGIVKFFNETKGFGFITDNKLKIDVFVHYTQVNTETKHLTKGQTVTYAIEETNKGPKAINVFLKE